MGSRREVLAGLAALAGVGGLVFVPTVAIVVLSLYGLVMVARYVPVAASQIGGRALLSRVALGASVGPWFALAVPSVGAADVVQIAVGGALFGIFSVELGSTARGVKRDGWRETFGIRASGPSTR